MYCYEFPYSEVCNTTCSQGLPVDGVEAMAMSVNRSLVKFIQKLVDEDDCVKDSASPTLKRSREQVRFDFRTRSSSRIVSSLSGLAERSSNAHHQPSTLHDLHHKNEEVNLLQREMPSG
ncbi:hypothetical protein L1987_16225 [Smallanthus sonchifolius]|uniref:Uncharacterized protein n=1 Tax=Smallanthus sonchifolius TaxID=185202 RepID=A0ACB9J890_9ASTR|nr:hypothetical protein L1987_16225 [Smallanthus sonchifolius]